MPALIERGPALLRHGYPYLLSLRRRRDAPTAEIRLLGRPALVLSGPDGARLFYDESRMRRRGAIPRPLRRTLFGDGAVHGLDGEWHRARKQLFLDLLTDRAAREIAAVAGELWRRRRLGELDPNALFGHAVAVHAGAVCSWAGVPHDAVPPTLARDLACIVDGFGAVGLRALRARAARRRADRWAGELIGSVRSQAMPAQPDSALARIARHTDPDGLLPVRTAAVELLNVLRPTVAVAWFVAFAAHRLVAQPALRARLQDADPATVESFAHELRRYYPFVPALAARATQPTEFDGHHLPRGRRVVLDVYGTLHDDAVWPEPDRFDVDRFRDRDPDPWTFIPQGGGPKTGHRCPGERVAVELIGAALPVLLDLPAPARRPELTLDRMPTRPL